MKESRSLEILAAKPAAYSASDTDRSSSVSNTLTFPLLLGVTISAIDAFVAVRHLNLEESELNLRELTAAAALAGKNRDVRGKRGGDRMKERLDRGAERAREEAAAMRRIYRGRRRRNGECRERRSRES